jgi:tetratricopeptide (TPR) repeat protein
MLVRREVFESIGGFDEGYQNGFEDVDLCLQIRERGGRIVYQPKSVLYHLEEQTPGRKAHEKANHQRLLERWGHHWWLPDEDTIYVPDGYALRGEEVNGRLHQRLEPLGDPHERARWECVAEAQRLAHRQDRDGLHRVLAKATDWPKDCTVLRWAAAVCRWAGAPELAEPFWSTLLTLQEAPDARAALASCALKDGRLHDAEQHLAALFAQDPCHAEGWLSRGVLAMQQAKYEEAASAFATARQHGGDPYRTRMGSGMAAMEQGDAERAWEQFEAARAANPDAPEAIHWLLRAGTALNRWQPLAGHLAHFLERNPADLAVRFALAGVLVRSGRIEDARREAGTIRLLQPGYEGLVELEQALNGHDS